MKSTIILFPHQLFRDTRVLKNKQVYLVEADLFFNQFPFHKQKIAYHRATMQSYKSFIDSVVSELIYIDAQSPCAKVSALIEHLSQKNIKEIKLYPLHDDWLTQQIEKACGKHEIHIKQLDNKMFLNPVDDMREFFTENEDFFHHHFYQQQRRKHNLLMDGNKPRGDCWSFDKDNRKKYPKRKTPPTVNKPQWTDHHQQALDYTQEHFQDNYGSHLKRDSSLLYPINHDQADSWLEDFLSNRFSEFGPYEDAICAEHSFLHHSLLTPMLNIGLLTPDKVIRQAIRYADEHDIPINSLEGFIRQIIGWREYIHGLYHFHGRKQRTANHWNHQRAMPTSFYTAETGIEPLDKTIKKVLKTGYCHHIERLMVLGNFMFLCEIHPDAIYQWFMELFIDAYDWVMVPNVYGMSQFADKGLMSTKPYISGSNYIKKMSDYSSGDWCDTWDGLYWRFIDKHITYFKQNNRTAMMAHNWLNQDKSGQDKHLSNADNFLSQL